MNLVLGEKSERALAALFPQNLGQRASPSALVESLIDAEGWRKGAPDPVSGALHPFALTQGSVLKEEYDLSTHGHGDGWVLGALLADPVELTLFNMKHGFAKGDLALKAIVTSLRAVAPKSKVVRLHADGFAALLGPTSEQSADEFTLGLFELTVLDPPHWQVLGPLAWAESERALFIARKAPWTGVLRRRLELGGRLPELPR
jgi:hypothetical protein